MAIKMATMWWLYDGYMAIWCVEAVIIDWWFNWIYNWEDWPVGNTENERELCRSKCLSSVIEHEWLQHINHLRRDWTYHESWLASLSWICFSKSLYTLHSTLHTLYSTHSRHYTPHTLHFTLHNPHSTLPSSHFTLHTSHSTLYTLHNPHSTL